MQKVDQEYPVRGYSDGADPAIRKDLYGDEDHDYHLSVSLYEKGKTGWKLCSEKIWLIVYKLLFSFDSLTSRYALSQHN